MARRCGHSKPVCLSEATVIFPSTAGALRDPNTFGKQWRNVREQLRVPGVTTHSFRKTVATLIDEEGRSARIGADHLGHSKVSMTHSATCPVGECIARLPRCWTAP